MKRIFITACGLFLLACNSGEEKQEPVATAPAVVYFDTDTVVVWNNDAEKQERYRILQLSDSIDKVQPLINGINSTYPEIRLLFSAISGDTLIVTLDNSKLLTNQMGNSGAEQYLSFAAMNLLEAKGVNHVKFALPEGAHARSSVWSSADFRDWKTDTTTAK